MLVLLAFVLCINQCTDLKAGAPAPAENQYVEPRVQVPKSNSGPIVISAIRTYEPIILLVRDSYRCRDLELHTQIPSDKTVYATTPGGVRISEFHGLFATKTTFDFGGYKKVVSVHKNGKIVIE